MLRRSVRNLLTERRERCNVTTNMPNVPAFHPNSSLRVAFEPGIAEREIEEYGSHCVFMDWGVGNWVEKTWTVGRVEFVGVLAYPVASGMKLEMARRFAIKLDDAIPDPPKPVKRQFQALTPAASAPTRVKGSQGAPPSGAIQPSRAGA